ncbi:McrC family protein [Kitasatospora sp. NPDC088783]|uniref:McrC family protein n=1 Tax=Kitasatospora sp. NPDC088783 TaxID=3364077 RepID=UPI00382B1E37
MIPGPGPHPGTALIDITEGDDWTPWVLTTAQVDTVRSKPKLVEIRPAGGNRWDIRARRTIGAVHLGTGAASVQLRIAPKMPIDRLLYLLTYTPALGTWQPNLVDAAAREGLFPAVAYRFATAAEHALRPGVLTGYQYIETTSMELRGRLRTGAQLRRRPGQALPLEIGYHERTHDIADNQLLRTAVRRLAAIPFDLGPGLRRRLRSLDVQLDGVSVLRSNSSRPEWKRTRLNVRYTHAIRLAELILDGCSFEYDHGHGISRVLAEGLLVRMEDVFEHFLVAALGAHFTRLVGGVAQAHPRTHYLDEQRRHPIYPDLVHLLPSDTGVPAPAIVVDAKYQYGLTTSNLYQMLAYCNRFGLNEGHLVCLGESDDVPTRVGSVLIHRHALDISLPAADLAQRLQQLSQNILNSRTSGS